MVGRGRGREGYGERAGVEGWRQGEGERQWEGEEKKGRGQRAEGGGREDDEDDLKKDLLLLSLIWLLGSRIALRRSMLHKHRLETLDSILWLLYMK
ncbi:hypothetical protein MRB53_014639 [Persea americana]|uniref:Uncharacterized protein n=1 Tax=Persea americana TaxID=3435 RepID=A0ACC2KBL4_PERAE|nr:hypothetical protein MRB53_014639 [Persea americana]